MAKRVKMQVQLPAATARFIRRQVELGKYPNAGAVIEALCDTAQTPRPRAARLPAAVPTVYSDEDMNRLIDEAKRDRRKAVVPDEAFWADMHARVERAAKRAQPRRRSA